MILNFVATKRYHSGKTISCFRTHVTCWYAEENTLTWIENSYLLWWSWRRWSDQCNSPWKLPRRFAFQFFQDRWRDWRGTRDRCCCGAAGNPSRTRTWAVPELLWNIRDNGQRLGPTCRTPCSAACRGTSDPSGKIKYRLMLVNLKIMALV